MALCKQFPEKIQYPDMQSAILAAQKLNIRPSYNYSVHAYKCFFCKAFHVGRKNKLNPIKDKDRERHYKNLVGLLKAAKKIKIPKKK